MLDIATITTIIGAATSAVGLLDQIADQVQRFIKKEKGEPVPEHTGDHKMKIEQEGNSMVSKIYGQTLQKISASDLQRLPDSVLLHVRVLEQSMQNNYALWSAIYPQLALLSPTEKAQTEIRLKQQILAMKGDMEAILKFLQTAGFQLDDHYIEIQNTLERYN
ncbi:hypothetical protein [Spirosoma luteum]|uniref:hypothetical protein n=1 Tax=Spirosoma luteum TaxID=431553 RepID=UPI0003790FD3|nr:hypothetical protein [Spirosoma luteum]